MLLTYDWNGLVAWMSIQMAELYPPRHPACDTGARMNSAS